MRLALQAGISVYELADSDHLLAVRIYDDVAPPIEAAASRAAVKDQSEDLIENGMGPRCGCGHWREKRGRAFRGLEEAEK
jgi:hypothetical protein